MRELATRVDARTNRLRLLEAATAVFAAQGTTADVKAVADQAGLAVGTIYRHFPGKDDLIAAVMEAAMQDFDGAAEAGLAEADPTTGIRVFIAGGLAVFARYGELMTAMLEGRAPGARTVAEREYRRAGTSIRITQLVQRGVASGVFRADLNTDVAAALLKAIFVSWALGELRRQYTLEQIADDVVAIFVAAMATQRS